jgi:hypothetical protein
MTASEKAGGTAQSGHGILERIKHEKQITLPMCHTLPECHRETSCGGKTARVPSLSKKNKKTPGMSYLSQESPDSHLHPT